MINKQVGYTQTLQSWMEKRKACTINHIADLLECSRQKASKLINAEPGYNPKLSDLLMLKEITGLTLNELASSFKPIRRKK